MTTGQSNAIPCWLEEIDPKEIKLYRDCSEKQESLELQKKLLRYFRTREEEMVLKCIGLPTRRTTSVQGRARAATKVKGRREKTFQMKVTTLSPLYTFLYPLYTLSNTK